MDQFIALVFDPCVVNPMRRKPLARRTTEKEITLLTLPENVSKNSGRFHQGYVTFIDLRPTSFLT
jgi:hypothetical protein